MLTVDAGPSPAGARPPATSSTRPRVGHGMRERNVAPAEARRAHVDAVGPGPEALAGDDASLGLDARRRLRRLRGKPVGDAARAVAAGAGQRAVVVVDE